MVLHRHVRKRDQSSFLLQERFFSFATALSSRSSTVLPLAGRQWPVARLALASCNQPAPACLAAAVGAATCQTRTQFVGRSVGHITSYLPPIYTSLPKSGTLSLTSLLSPPGQCLHCWEGRVQK